MPRPRWARARSVLRDKAFLRAPAIINDLAPPGAAGRYNGLGALAFTTGFLLGPVGGAAALGAGWGSGLFAVMVLACAVAAVAGLRLDRHLPPGANQIAAAATPSATPAESQVPSQQARVTRSEEVRAEGKAAACAAA